MKKSRFTEEQIAYALRLAESGTTVTDVCRQIGIAEATFYVWKKKYADLGVAELRRLMAQMRESSCCARAMRWRRSIPTRRSPVVCPGSSCRAGRRMRISGGSLQAWNASCRCDGLPVSQTTARW